MALSKKSKYTSKSIILHVIIVKHDVQLGASDVLDEYLSEKLSST